MIRLVSIFFLVAGLGIYFFWPDNRTGNEENIEIRMLLSDPRKYDGKDVKIRGSISGNLSLFKFGGFFVEDKGSKIAVFTKRGSPKDGEVVEVRGVFKQAYQFGNVDQSVIFER